MDKKLIFRDAGAKLTFRNEVEQIKDKANALINAFNKAQDFTTIDTLEQFESLLKNPVEMYDDILIQNCEIKSKTGRNPEPSVLASLFGYNRQAYLDLIGWEDISVFGNKGSSKAKPKLFNQKGAINAYMYERFKPYLVFKGLFRLDETALEEKLKEFDIYAESPEQLKLVEHYETLCGVLNEACEFHQLSLTRIQELAQWFGFLILDNKLVINDISLSQQIKYL